MAKVWGRLRGVMVVALVAAGLALAAGPAQAQVNAISISSGPAFPVTAAVGDQNRAGLLTFTNNSIGNLSTAPVTLTNIRLNPSCASSGTAVGSEPCTQPEPRTLAGPIFNIAPVGTGRAGTACAGILFSVSSPNANGTVSLAPSGSVVLGPSATGGTAATCVIDFTFDVLQRPLDGSTVAVSSVDAAAPNPTPPPAIVPAFNIPGTSSTITVSEAPTMIATAASPQTVASGGVFSDTATVTGVPGGPPLTGTVLFALYRSAPGNPGFPTCTPAEQVTTSNAGSVPVTSAPAAPNGAPRATATFTPLPVQPAGRYAFVATYDQPGSPNPDANHLSSASACADPLEQVTVAQVLPTITVVTTASPTTVTAPGGTVIFTIQVINTGSNPVTLTSLTDSVYGNLNGQGTCAVGPVLAANGGTYACSFSAPVPAGGGGVGGQSQTNVVTVNATDANNNTALASDDTTVTITSSTSRYVPLTPLRIEDTRTGAGGLAGPVGPGATVDVQITGRAGVPEGASAVVLNVTVTQPTAEGYLTLYPSGSPRPLAANVNFTPGKTVPNLVVVKLGTGGKVSMFNSTGTTHVIDDVAGYFLEGSGGNAGRYLPLVPARIADTRNNVGGMRLGPGQSLDLQVTGQGGAPAAGVSAAVLNVAVTNTTGVSYLTVYPTGEARPFAANLNFTPGDTVSNRTMTKVGAGGKVTIYNNAGDADVVVDIGGTFTDSTVAGPLGTYAPLTPSRILDTRSSTPIPSGGSIAVQVTGQGGVPASGVRAVILSVAVTQPTGNGYLTISPTGTARPLASDLNYAPNETRANLVVVQVGPDGKVNLFTSTQSHVVFDVAGWFT